MISVIAMSEAPLSSSRKRGSRVDQYGDENCKIKLESNKYKFIYQRNLIKKWKMID